MSVEQIYVDGKIIHGSEMVGGPGSHWSREVNSGKEGGGSCQALVYHQMMMAMALSNDAMSDGMEN